MLYGLLTLIVWLGAFVSIAALVIAAPIYLIRRRKKRIAMRDYVRRLGRVLRVRYDIQQSYSPTQVIQMMRKWGYSSAFNGYGLALYCTQSDFDAYYSRMTEPYDYAMTRDEICRHLPFVDADFSAADVVMLGDRINAQGRAQKKADDDIEDSSDVDDVSGFIRSDTGKDYGDNFEDRSSSGGGHRLPYDGGFSGFD